MWRIIMGPSSDICRRLVAFHRNYNRELDLERVFLSHARAPKLCQIPCLKTWFLKISSRNAMDYTTPSALRDSWARSGSFLKIQLNWTHWTRILVAKRIWNDKLWSVHISGIRASRVPSAPRSWLICGWDVWHISKLLTYQQKLWHISKSSDISAICLDLVWHISIS